MSDRTLVVFVKEPRPGAVKTRLAADVGPEAAAELYRALVESVLEATTPVPGEYERLVFFDPPEARRGLREWLPGVSLRAQSAGELGERMADAFARAFGRGATRVAIVGSDVPGVTRGTVLRALEELGEADVVLGPAEDGGYYLIALREPHPELVRGIDWSTPRCCGRRSSGRAAAGLVVRQLETLRDVDTLADLRAEWPALEGRLSTRPELLADPRARPRASGVGSRLPEVSMGGVRTYLEALMTLDEAPLKLEPGQVIFSAGDAGQAMFIVRTGSVDLRIGETVLETVEQGGIFGELALVDPGSAQRHGGGRPRLHAGAGRRRGLLRPGAPRPRPRARGDEGDGAPPAPHESDGVASSLRAGSASGTRRASAGARGRRRACRT